MVGHVEVACELGADMEIITSSRKSSRYGLVRVALRYTELGVAAIERHGLPF